jgi:hypothetical protein
MLSIERVICVMKLDSIPPPPLSKGGKSLHPLERGCERHAIFLKGSKRHAILFKDGKQ